MARLFVFIIPIFLASLISSVGFAADPYHAFTITNSTVWKESGYSYKDCQPLEPGWSERKDVGPVERAMIDRRFLEGGKKACEERRAYTGVGLEVAIIRNSDGSLKSEERELVFSGQFIKKKFYRVWYRNDDGSPVTGWISEHQLTKPVPEKELPDIKPDIVQPAIPDCPPVGSKQSNGAPEVRKQGQALNEFIESPELGVGRKIDHNNKKLSAFKSDAEIDRYMCLYRAGANESQFANLLKKFQKAAKAAEASFGVPYALTMCFALTESSLKFEDEGEYRGFFQFGSQRVEDLKKAIARSPYDKMWSKYKSKVSSKLEFNDDSIRSFNDPNTQAAAFAMAARQMYGDLFRHGKCMDCSSAASSNPKKDSMANINRKDLYLMIGGYNFTPSKIPAMARRSPAALASSFPPPKESRNYMEQMDNCLSKGEEARFRQASSDKANERRHKEIAQLKKAKGAARKTEQLKKLESLVAAGASQEYENKLAECNRTHPPTK